MRKNDKIYVAGHAGLVGSALIRALSRAGYSQIIVRTRQELDLIDSQAVFQFFKENQPDYVFLAAAKVGGILANNTYPADFIWQNLQIQNNIINAAYQCKVKRLLFLGSSCIYPRECPQPIKEEYLLTGPLEPTNRPYALAKIAGIETCWAFNRQFGTRFLTVMPTNLYGPGDNYNLETSHVIPALIRKMHEAKMASLSEVIVWGTGQARREFLYSDDLAEACLFLMNLEEKEFGSFTPPLINVGWGEDLTIVELAHLIAKLVNFKGKIEFDTTKPDGTARKLLDTFKINQLGWHPQISLEVGLKLAYQQFVKQYAAVKA